MENKFNEWIDKLAKRKSEIDRKKKRALQKEAVGNRRQDMSRPILEKLLSDGYDLVIWNSGQSICPFCLELHNQEWRLEDFLSGLAHDAPIFEKSHPGDKNCGVVVRGPELPDVFVDSFGNLSEL